MLQPVKAFKRAIFHAVSGVAAALEVALVGLEAVLLLEPAPVGEAEPVRFRL